MYTKFRSVLEVKEIQVTSRSLRQAATC